MKKIRAYSAFVATSLLLVVLNVSIDIPDELIHPPNATAQSLNEIESVAEFVFESCLNYENSFPENPQEDDTGNNNNLVKKNIEGYVRYNQPVGLTTNHYRFTGYGVGHTNGYVGRLLAEIPSPPPRTV